MSSTSRQQQGEVSAPISPKGAVGVCALNLGCKVNRVELDDILAHLETSDVFSADLPDADVVVVNTCTVTHDAEKKTRKAVRHVLAQNAQALVLVTGCAAVITPDFYRNLDARVRVVDKSAVVSVVNGMSGNAPVSEDSLRMGAGFRTRVGLKVQDGCDNACTYCIVHVARGASVSMPFETIIADAARHTQAGATELVLTGINLGAYRDGDKTLVDLLRAISALPGMFRIRIGSIEPGDVSDGLIDLLATSDGRICRHLHLPLQSGSTEVLHRMARPYDARFYTDLVDRLRSRVASLSLSTDVIVGFPAETTQQFEETLEVCRTCGFSRIHVFRYSEREGTPAASWPHRIPMEVRRERAEVLSRLASELRLRDARSRVGTEEVVVVEAGGWGTTESYHRVRLDSSNAARGTLLRLSLTEPDEDGIFQV